MIIDKHWTWKHLEHIEGQVLKHIIILISKVVE